MAFYEAELAKLSERISKLEGEQELEKRLQPDASLRDHLPGVPEANLVSRIPQMKEAEPQGTFGQAQNPAVTVSEADKSAALVRGTEDPPIEAVPETSSSLGQTPQPVAQAGSIAGVDAAVSPTDEKPGETAAVEAPESEKEDSSSSESKE